jgi:hypothetical protein
MDCGIGFTDAELAIIRTAINGGAVGVCALLIAFTSKLLKQWLDWRK